METKVKRRSWYDGWLYSVFIDSKNSGLRHRILRFIQSHRRIIDIGCGTGGLVLRLAERAEKVVGVDISERMIRTANKRLQKSGFNNVEFVHASATHLQKAINEKFDYALFSFFIHEIAPAQRLTVLNEAKKIAGKIIIFDYRIPLSRNLFSAGIYLIEFIAGREHFRNFKEFKKTGGLNFLLEKAGLKIVKDQTNSKNLFRIVETQAK